MAFAFGWTPCIGPILGSILVLASTEESLGRGILLLFFYSENVFKFGRISSLLILIFYLLLLDLNSPGDG